jgi:hypothetical protein
MSVSKNARKGTVARCRHCDQPIQATAHPGLPGRWKDSQGGLCEASATGMHQP